MKIHNIANGFVLAVKRGTPLSHESYVYKLISSVKYLVCALLQNVFYRGECWGKMGKSGERRGKVGKDGEMWGAMGKSGEASIVDDALF